MNTPQMPSCDRLTVSREKLRQALKTNHGDSSLAAAVLRSVVAPLAQRNPWGLVGSALVVGCLVIWKRQWCLSVASTLVAELLPKMVSIVVTQVQPMGWVEMLLLLIDKVLHSKQSSS